MTRNKELVVFDADGNEIDWVDPYVNHLDFRKGRFMVSNGYSFYSVQVPEGGRYEIREVS